MKSPYSGLPSRQFWRNAVAPVELEGVTELYRKRFKIDGLKIATAGSCFAQHIARTLRNHDYDVLDKEPGPQGLSVAAKQKYGYGLYSARHGNIYDARRLLQLAQEALGQFSPRPRAYIWEKNARFYDGLRVSVEPEGLPTREEVATQRRDHVRRFRQVLEEAQLFVFTFGLTEAWAHKSGLVFSGAPGVIAGDYDLTIHFFKNFSFQEIYDDFASFRTLVHTVNPQMKFLITVSPVPLAATYEDAHVLVSTIHSKAKLRTVAGQLYRDFPDIDYFPSYELLSTPFLGRPRFDKTKRNVEDDGVEAAMRLFLAEHLGQTAQVTRKIRSGGTKRSKEDIVCEEALLEAFA